LIQEQNVNVFLKEVRANSNVYSAGLLSVNGNLAPAQSNSFFVQGEDPVARFTVIFMLDSNAVPENSFYSNQGSRIPTDFVTDFSQDFVLWTYTPKSILSAGSGYPTGPQTVRLTGRQICPANDRSVYIKFDAASALNVTAPLFWTQAGGSNAVFYPGGTAGANLRSLVVNGTSAALFDDTVQNEDVCFSYAALDGIPAINGTRVFQVPLAVGQKLFFAAGVTDDTSIFLLSFGNGGYSPFVDGVVPVAVDITGDLAAWLAPLTGVISIDTTASGATYLHAFAFDHLPQGTEFIEDEENFLDQYEIGICGSYNVEADGTYNPQQWKQHPYDCTDQFEGDKCMFCKGRANDKIVSLCLERLGSGCNAAFNTPARSVFCNLEFECPASTFSIPFVAVISLLVIVIFGF